MGSESLTDTGVLPHEQGLTGGICTNGVNDLCPICEEGNLQEHVEDNEVEYKGVKGRVPFYLSVCSECGSEQGSSAQVLQNKRSMMAFRKEVDG